LRQQQQQKTGLFSSDSRQHNLACVAAPGISLAGTPHTGKKLRMFICCKQHSCCSPLAACVAEERILQQLDVLLMLRSQRATNSS
jgi:hypothetical protein